MPDRHIIEFPPRVRQASTRLFFGGSFDPVHLGHLTLPKAVAAAMGGDWAVIYVPAGRSPFKPDQPTEPGHRVSMLTIGLRDDQRTWVWEQELVDQQEHPDQPSYWAQSWEAIGRMGLKGENRFLIGADQAGSMHRWHRYTEFWRDAVVMLRQGSESVDALMDQLKQVGVWETDDIEHWRSRVVVGVPTVDASSSAIRASLSDPTRRTKPIQGLDEQVQAYILEHGLYP
jgi:nicotinate-nucleotide adenylyltransferase